MIRLICAAIILIVVCATQCAGATDLAKIEATVREHLHLKEETGPDAAVKLSSVLNAVWRGDATKINDWTRAIYRYREGLGGFRDKVPHPFETIRKERVRSFMELLVFSADDLLTHRERCRADFLNWYKDATIYGLGRKSDRACEEQHMKEVPPGQYSSEYANYVWRKCYEASADPQERERLINDFAFIMDRLLLGELKSVYTDHHECEKPRPK